MRYTDCEKATAQALAKAAGRTLSDHIRVSSLRGQLIEGNMIKIEAFEGRFAPMCVCDICGLAITYADQGMVLYTAEPDGKMIAEVPFKVVHKGRCRADAIMRHGGEGADDELTTVLVNLLLNMGYRGDRLRMLIEGIEDMGNFG